MPAAADAAALKDPDILPWRQLPTMGVETGRLVGDETGGADGAVIVGLTTA